jgi:hypothetical protein
MPLGLSWYLRHPSLLEAIMDVHIHSHHELTLELRASTDLSVPPLFAEDVTDALADNAREAFLTGVTIGAIPRDVRGPMHVTLTPIGSREPFVERLRIDVGTATDRAAYTYELTREAWMRRAGERTCLLRRQGQLGEHETCHACLVAVPATLRHGTLRPPLLEVPPAVEKPLAAFGVFSYGSGRLDPDRPILVNRQLEDDIIARTQAAGKNETGGAVVGQLVWLPEPLPHTRAHIVTLLTMQVPDQRHEGSSDELRISTDALAEAARIAQLRGERVLTVWHSHGWCPSTCPSRASCLVSPSETSPQDYEVARELFPSKTTVMPICGFDRSEPDVPVLYVHGWCRGVLSPIAYLRYEP